MNPRSMKYPAAAALRLSASGAPAAGENGREPVDTPAMVRQHMPSNMRDHLAALDGILSRMAAGDPEGAAQTAESPLGMSALESHGAACHSGYRIR